MEKKRDHKAISIELEEVVEELESREAPVVVTGGPAHGPSLPPDPWDG
jgi:hypothetical protein